MLKWRLTNSEQDILGKPFWAYTYRFDGLQNKVETTLIERRASHETTRAVLYLHGYTDYFFQTPLAEHFVRQGRHFYAVDLQGYGRSIRPNSRPNWCENLSQYHDDITIALSELANRGVQSVVILAHSTGGLIASSYLQQYLSSEDEHRQHPKIDGLILNSPFLELPFSPDTLKRLSLPIRIAVSLLPFHNLRAEKISIYAQTLHRSFQGEWSYRLDWKPSQGFPLSFHWLKQVIFSQSALRQHPISLPTLVCHSARTTRKLEDIDATRQGDGVLDVASMVMAAQRSFTHLTLGCIEGGFHDLFLSPEPIRRRYLQCIDQWLAQLD